MTWMHNGVEFNPTLEEIQKNKWIGFVYIITHLESGKKYVGQKKLTKKVKRVRKGYSRKITEIRMSDWPNYWGSSRELQEMVEADEPEAFKREVLHLCQSKTLLNWLETKEQLIRNVIFDDSYLNNMVNIRCGGPSAKSLSQFGEICRY